MAASVQFRPQNRDLEMVMREVDEDLAVFLGMRTAEKERIDHPLVQESHEFSDSKGRNYDSPIEAEINPVIADDCFLKLEMESEDHDWLLAQADTSVLPSAQTDSCEISYGEGIPQLHDELLPASTGANIRPLSSEKQRPARRAATPTARPTLREKPKPSRASTPTPRSTFPSSKPHARSSTPTSGSRSSTPASRASAPMSATPTRTPLITTGRKTGSTMSKNTSSSSSSTSSRGASPTVKSRPSKRSELPTLSQNVKTSTIRRPASASRGRPAAAATHSASSNGKPQQKSCSPAKIRAPANTYKSSSKILTRSRAHANDGDDVNPVLMGTQMVHRVVNMRKLAPPKQDEYVPHDNHRKSSHENSGFGRSLSKNSLDMAIRHMDIGLGIADKLRPGAMTALSSTRISQSHAFQKSSTVCVLESPPSSSCDSSKSSLGINSHFFNGTELDD